MILRQLPRRWRPAVQCSYLAAKVARFNQAVRLYIFMARFFPYDEIVTRMLTPVKDIQWLAGQIENLPPFVEGNAVLCGSVSWGGHCWRSDIDVAHFSTISYPHVEQPIREVIQQYANRTCNQFIVPRVDVIPIGAESLTLVNNDKGVSSSRVSGGILGKRDRVSDVFVETAVRFADHIGSIANLRGDPWQTFLERHLSSVDGSRRGRREETKRYVGRMTRAWAQQPLHQLDGGPDGRFTPEQLDLISKSENYPVNLMRRILGDLGRYPCPDQASDVREAFSTLEEPWSKTLLAQFEPFFALDEQYEGIVAACKRPGTPLPEADYFEQVRSLFVDLPFVEIQNNIREYVGS